jgi:hypothetical protein
LIYFHSISRGISVVDNLNNVRRDASRHFRNKKKAYLKAKIEELETNSKINSGRDLYRGINDFKKRYQPRTIIVEDEKGDLFTDVHSIMARWRKYFSQLLNVHGVNDVRQAEIHTQQNHWCRNQVPLKLSWLSKR